MKTREKIIIWAEERGILTPEGVKKQLTKTLEELGETAGAYLKQNGLKVIDGAGDIFVTVIIVEHQLGIKNAIDKGLLLPEPQLKDATDYLFEIGAELKNINDLINRGAGDCAGFSIMEIVRYLRGFCSFIGHDLEFCLNHVYNEIKDRKGKKIDGVFVKDEE